MAYTGCGFAVISNTTQVLEEVLEQIYSPYKRSRRHDIIYDRDTLQCAMLDVLNNRTPE